MGKAKRQAKVCTFCNGSGRVYVTRDGKLAALDEVERLPLVDRMQLIGTNPGQPCECVTGKVIERRKAASLEELREADLEHDVGVDDEEAG